MRAAAWRRKSEPHGEAVFDLFKSSNPEDEFRVITVSSKPTSVASIGASLEEVCENLDHVNPSGFTSLWDAIYLGVSEMKESRFRRKAMVVISDGGDNHSRYTENEIKSILEESDTLVYAVGFSIHGRTDSKSDWDRFASMK